MENIKVGDKVRFTDSGTSWKDTSVHIREGVIDWINHDSYVIVWYTKNGKRKVSSILKDNNSPFKIIKKLK